jgi:plastocyanin
MSRLAFSLLLALAPSGASAASIEILARDPTGKPVADAAVYAVPASGGSETRSARAAIEQVDREFIPYVSVIQQGTSVAFPNRDPILHHVYSFSPAKAFEIKLYTGKSPSEIQFDKPGVVTLGCNIHDWMIAYIAVVPTPHFARTDASGTARLRDLPAGSYEVRAWHPQQRVALVPHVLALDAAANAQAAFTFVFDVVPRKAKFKPPLDRLRY